MSVQLRKLTDDLNKVQALADQPTITSSELKATFDEAGNIIKDYINNILLEDLQDMLDEVGNIDTKVATAMQTKLEGIYHVGKEIVTSVDVNPYTYLGFGTWELTGKGVVEIGVDPNVAKFNAGGKTGGSFSKTLSSGNIPQLNLNKQAVTNVTANINNNADLTYVQGTVVTGIGQSKETLKVGNANPTAIDITPSFTTVYRYVRTA